MTILQWQDPKEVRIGDTAPDLWFVVTEGDEDTVRDLTGHYAGVSFWYQDAVGPHVVRAAALDALNGQIQYRLQGDEFPTAGTCYLQWTIAAPASDSGSAGRGYFQISSEIMRRTVVG
jgi:hypothetical protein